MPSKRARERCQLGAWLVSTRLLWSRLCSSRSTRSEFDKEGEEGGGGSAKTAAKENERTRDGNKQRSRASCVLSLATRLDRVAREARLLLRSPIVSDVRLLERQGTVQS